MTKRKLLGRPSTGSGGTPGSRVTGGARKVMLPVTPALQALDFGIREVRRINTQNFTHQNFVYCL